MKWITGVLMALLVSGCSLTREAPPVQSYRLNDGAQIVVSSAEGCRERVIRIALIEAPQWLGGTAIHYAGSDHRFYRYTQARWEQSPVQQIQQMIEKSVIESGLFVGVVPYKSLAKNDWLLEVRIEQMLQTIGETGAGETELMLYAVLVDQYSRRILAQKTFAYRHKSAVSDVRSAMEGWSEGISEFKTALIAWLVQQCDTQAKVDRSDVNL
ncbi:ABC-type transport auxiliary lipoprotein family protein [Sulfurimonas diazotrophicus]|uniref:ABC-type transport auxiliary lipoprotein family protein n=1 Tax=Sulfurimonas diazotrophicus TaxID=3131939 RepID=A0ABZ3H8V2_9BACT